MNYTPIKSFHHFLQATLKVYNILREMSRAKIFDFNKSFEKS